MISYEGELDIDSKLNNFLKIAGILNNVFGPQKAPQENNNKTTQYTGTSGCFVIWQRNWTVKARDGRRITAAEMKYMRRTAGYTGTDCRTNGQIAKELK